MRLTVMAGFVALGSILAGQAFAWTPPGVGKTCATQRGHGPTYSKIAGNYLGGKLIRDGVVDRVSFQGCFENEQSCTAWLAEKSLTHPVSPGFARCTPVVLR
jgi:hypothetical protein